MMIFGGLMMVVFWGGLILLVVLAVQGLSRRARNGQESAIDVLKRRLASGEINQDEFDQARRTLQG